MKKCPFYLSSVVEKLAHLQDVDTSSCDNGQFGESVVSQVSIPHTVDPVSQTVSPDQICHHLTIICSVVRENHFFTNS